jgi:hypothetical protein
MTPKNDHPHERSEKMPDETNDTETSEQRETTPTTSGGTPLLTTETDTTESKDAPYQGKRSNGGYVPT